MHGSALMWVWAGCVVLALVVLWFLLRLMRFGGCGNWVAFVFWGGLSMWAVLMFLSGKVHL